MTESAVKGCFNSYKIVAILIRTYFPGFVKNVLEDTTEYEKYTIGLGEMLIFPPPFLLARKIRKQCLTLRSYGRLDRREREETYSFFGLFFFRHFQRCWYGELRRWRCLGDIV